MTTKEARGYDVSDLSILLANESSASDTQTIQSKYPEQFLFALQLEQVRVRQLLQDRDEYFDQVVLPRLRTYQPSITVSEYRNSIRKLIEMYTKAVKILVIFHKEANKAVNTERVSTLFRTQPANYPRIHTYDGKEYIPAQNGWRLSDGSEYVNNDSEDGHSIWLVAQDKLPPLYQCFIRLIQSDPKTLTQAELDIMCIFGFIDRRVVLSQEERDLRIALKTPEDARTSMMDQLIISSQRKATK